MTTRRTFLQATAGALATASLPALSARIAKHELTISKILIHDAKGRRKSPVAPNAYSPYRGYDTIERVLRIQTKQGLEGICHAGNMKPEALQTLIGLDPFELFRWDANDRIIEAAEPHRRLLEDLRGVDVALLDLMGQALKRPAFELLGEPVRAEVPAYDGSVYMEDLLKPHEREDLVFIRGRIPTDPVEWVVRKARWVVNERAEGFKALKIKVGRSKWMPTPEEALRRDIEVTLAVREAVGANTRLMVDANRDFSGRLEMAWKYAQGVANANVYFMEEMLAEDPSADIYQLKRRLREAGQTVKIAAGEFRLGGISKEIYQQRYGNPPAGEPLIDVEQADMNAHGFLYLRARAAEQARLGMTLAPHNFGSRLGFYAQVHLGRVIPNFEIAEVDDSEYPALIAQDIELRNGAGRVGGAPGLGVRLLEQHLEKPKVVLY